MNQVKVFDSEEALNKWLEVNRKYEIVDIKFQFAPATYRRFMVWYKKIIDKNLVLYRG